MSKLVLKIKRTDDAKEFPVLHVKKFGDVGLDIPAVLPVIDGWEERQESYSMDCEEFDDIPDATMMNDIKYGTITVNPGDGKLIPTGIMIEMPYTHWASIEARSSTSKQLAIVPKGVIDPGYRGELFGMIINVGREPLVVHHGDRLIQMILHENIVQDFTIEEVDELSKSERGESGFGSTGK